MVQAGEGWRELDHSRGDFWVRRAGRAWPLCVPVCGCPPWWLACGEPLRRPEVAGCSGRAGGGRISAAHGLGGGHSPSHRHHRPQSASVPGTALFEDSKVDNEATPPALAALSRAGGTQASAQTVSTSSMCVLRGSEQYFGNSEERGLEPCAGNVVREGFLEEMVPSTDSLLCILIGILTFRKSSKLILYIISKDVPSKIWDSLAEEASRTETTHSLFLGGQGLTFLSLRCTRGS